MLCNSGKPLLIVTTYRVEDNNGNKRSMDDIVSYEIINAINEVLELQIALNKIDLIRETAKKFGYTRLGSVIETSIGNAIDMGVRNEVLEIVEGEKIVKK